MKKIKAVIEKLVKCNPETKEENQETKGEKKDFFPDIYKSIMITYGIVSWFLTQDDNDFIYENIVSKSRYVPKICFIINNIKTNGSLIINIAGKEEIYKPCEISDDFVTISYRDETFKMYDKSICIINDIKDNKTYSIIGSDGLNYCGQVTNFKNKI